MRVTIRGIRAHPNKMHFVYTTGLHWLNAEGICGTYGYDRDDIPEDVLENMVSHTKDTFYAFLTIQHIMLNASDCFQNGWGVIFVEKTEFF